MASVSTLVLLAIGATPTGQIRLANLPDEALVHLGVALKHLDASGLTQLLAAQRDPSSPSYHAWLDPQSFGARFGLSEADYASVMKWFSSRGFAVTPYPNRSFFEAVGRVDVVRGALGVQMHAATLGGRRFRTFEGDLALPSSIASRVLHISGLDTRRRFHHRPHPHIIAFGYDGGVLGPDDLRLEYDMVALTSTGKAAAGLATAVLGTQEGTTTQQDCYYQDPGSAPFITPSSTAIEAYFTLGNATAVYNPIVLPNANDDFDTCGANQEYQLDVQMQSVGAPNAKTINLVLSPASEVFTTGAQYIVNSLPAVVAVSTSLGECEPNAVRNGGGPMVTGSEMQVLQQTVDQGLAEGQTWFAASGDNGADDCGDESSGSGNGFGNGNATVDFPGVLPEIVDMGGAQFSDLPSWGPTGSLLAFVSEVVWNEGSEGGGAGGGGQSLYYAKPAYQVGVGPEASDGTRDVPDLALEAAAGTPGIAVYECGSGQDPNICQDDTSGSGNLDIVGGTSVASPLAAGMFALLAGEVGCSQGDIHAEIYALGTAQQNGGPTVFNDITSGNNDFVDPFGDTITGFSAGTGYDLVSGWGSIDVAALVSSWPSCPTPTTSSTGTSTGAASTTSAASSSSTGGGSSTGGTTGGGTSTGSSTGSSSGSSSGARVRPSATSTSNGGEVGQISRGGCSSGGGAALLWVPLVFGLFGFRRRR